MAEVSTVARPYAKAAFEYAQEKGVLTQWSDMLSTASAVAANSDMLTSWRDKPAARAVG